VLRLPIDCDSRLLELLKTADSLTHTDGGAHHFLILHASLIGPTQGLPPLGPSSANEIRRSSANRFENKTHLA